MAAGGDRTRSDLPSGKREESYRGCSALWCWLLGFEGPRNSRVGADHLVTDPQRRFDQCGVVDRLAGGAGDIRSMGKHVKHFSVDRNSGRPSRLLALVPGGPAYVSLILRNGMAYKQSDTPQLSPYEWCTRS